MQTIDAHGMRMPKLGLGTFRLKGEECAAAVEGALGLGYRHIDTAEMYDNEEAVGRGIAASGVARGDIFLTTKVWWEHLGGDAMQRAAEASLKRLGTDYVDLYLIHWPAPEMDLADALEKLVRLKQQGLAGAIGVANFPSALLRRAVGEIGAPIACNQFEHHVLLGQRTMVEAVREVGAAAVAYCPLAQGRLAEQPALEEIGRKHGVSAAQVALAWLLEQESVAAIPKAGRRESQQANLDALKVTLDETDRAAIAALPKDQRCVNPGFAPAWDPVG